MVESVEKMEKQLTVRELERLIFLTFMHSQGSPEVQELLNEWITSVYGLQDEHKVREAFANFLDSHFSSSDSSGELHLGKKNLHEELPRSGVERELGYLDSLYKIPDEPLEGEAFFKILLQMILQRDHQFIFSKGGRPNRNDSEKGDNLKNKFFSFTKTYLNDKTPTGDAALDQLYAKLHDWVIDRPEHDEVVEILQEQERKLANQ